MSRLTLICLHGFTQNGSLMQRQVSALSRRFPDTVEVICPDAPHDCAPESVARMAAAFSMPELPPAPHLCWWNASDDGLVYRGWEATRERLSALCEQAGQHSRVGVLGFSQGAIATAAIAGLHEHKEFPALAFAVLIAGRTPRAQLLRPHFQAPLTLPSLHIWGKRDTGAVMASPALAELFSSATREVVTWTGPHAVPGLGPAADAIVDWVTSYA